MNCCVDNRSIFDVKSMQFLVKLGYIFRQVRWNQWYKGFFTFFALLWVPHQSTQYVSLALAGAIAFNLASSIVYIINDFRDIERDKFHPSKKFRPLVSGQLSPWEAYALMIILSGMLLIIVGVISSTAFASILLGYLLGNLIYTYGIKHIPYLDITFVAAFSSMRVVAGFFLLGIPVAWNFVAVIFTLVLFVMAVKRLAEMSLATFKTRPALQFYSPHILKLLMTIFMMITVIMYYFAMSIAALPLIYTDILYFLVLLSVHQYMAYGENDRAVAENGFLFLVHSRLSLVLLTLLILTLATFIILFV